MYVELHARSAFSFLEGASVPEELAGACASHQMRSMAFATFVQARLLFGRHRR